MNKSLLSTDNKFSDEIVSDKETKYIITFEKIPEANCVHAVVTRYNRDVTNILGEQVLYPGDNLYLTFDFAIVE